MRIVIIGASALFLTVLAGFLLFYAWGSSTNQPVALKTCKSEGFVLAAPPEPPAGEHLSERFLVVADWHNGNVYETDPPSSETVRINSDRAAAIQARFGGDAVIMPGDILTARWFGDAYLEDPEAKGDPSRAIEVFGERSYGAVRALLEDNGWPVTLAAIGDHEVGNDPWRTGKTKLNHIHDMRSVFSKVWAPSSRAAEQRFEAKIGVAARPRGDIYEGTSYAALIGDVLIVTVDQFFRLPEEAPDSDKGRIVGDVEGCHLVWLDTVLAATRAQGAARHIIVQGHLPALTPVRMSNSSGMTMRNGLDSAFLETLRRHDVDVYLAGEVHVTTVTKDPRSDLVQIVSRGNRFEDLLVIDVEAERLNVTLVNDPAGAAQTVGRLTLDQSRPSPIAYSEGGLVPIDLDAPTLSYDFERLAALSDFYVVNLGRVEGLPHEPDQDVFVNNGSFADQYALAAIETTFVDGVSGRAAALGPNSALIAYGMGSAPGPGPWSYSMWFKTNSPGRHVLLSTVAIWNNKPAVGLLMEDGALRLRLSRQVEIGADEPMNVADGRWHHVAMVQPAGAEGPAGLQLYLDGARVALPDDTVAFSSHANHFSIGGIGLSSPEAFGPLVVPFVGAVDDVAVWARTLSPQEISALASKGGGPVAEE